VGLIPTREKFTVVEYSQKVFSRSTIHFMRVLGSDDAKLRLVSGAGTPPEPELSEEDELAARLRLVIGRLHRRFSRRAVGGLTPSQLSVLVTVEQHGPLRLGDLAAREVITPPTVTRLVASLQDRALVNRVTDPEDGRAALIEMSKTGTALLEEIRRERTAFIAQRLGRLEASQQARVASAVALLEQLIDVPEDH
jgi:DNA-binding MarR family transcriptional regulator